MHVWLTQATGVSHVPLDEHVWVAPVPEHCVDPGEQDPVHDADAPPSAPGVHVELVHGTAVPQLPEESHVSTPLPEHCVWPGAHAPTHCSFTHA